MFERFTDEARQIVVAAREEARGLRARQIEPVHLLLALARSAGPGGSALRTAGVDHDRLRAAVRRSGGPWDGDALATVGIDLAAVRAAAEAAFGPGALDGPGDAAGSGRLPFAEGSRRSLELTVRLVGRRRLRSIDGTSLLSGVLSAGDPAVTRVLQQLGADPAALRDQVGGPGEVA